LQELIAELCVDAMSSTARSKVEETAHQWLGRPDLDPDDPRSIDAVAEALLRASEIATFAPSFTGATAIDRLATQRKSADGEARAALEALKQASFRILRISSPERQGLRRVEDLATREEFLPTRSRRQRWVCPSTRGFARFRAGFRCRGPADAARRWSPRSRNGFDRPGRGLANPERCAALSIAMSCAMALRKSRTERLS